VETSPHVQETGLLYVFFTYRRPVSSTWRTHRTDRSPVREDLFPLYGEHIEETGLHIEETGLLYLENT